MKLTVTCHKLNEKFIPWGPNIYFVLFGAPQEEYFSGTVSEFAEFAEVNRVQKY